jgi:hypothetical protein
VATMTGLPPCEQVFYWLSHPTMDPESRAKRNRKLPGCGFARLVECSLSVGDFTPACMCVAREKLAVWRCSSSHNKPLHAACETHARERRR